jgi:dienelactone hydrolase
MFRLIAGAVLAGAVLIGSAQAQLPDAARFVDPIAARSATISPSGSYVAYIRRDATSEAVIVLDMATNSGRAVARFTSTEGRIDWVEWKNDDRLILSATVYQSFGGGRGTGTNLRQESFDYTVTRVISIDRNGGSAVPMFEGQRRQLGYGFGSTFLLDILPNEPGHVLLSAWEQTGHGVWRADVATGRVERVYNGEFDTVGYATDGAGTPVIRIDAIGRSGYRILRRPPGQRSWTAVFEARRTATATNSPDFQVIGPGPGSGQVYVIARPDNRDLTSLYLFNTVTGELGAPIQEGTQADVGDAPWIHPDTRELIAACEWAARLSCTARDPSMQRHLNAVNAYFDDAASVFLVDMSDDASRWLFLVDGPTHAGSYYLYDRDAARMVEVAALRPRADETALSPSEEVTYQARDGTQLWAYVTARPGVAGPRPTVVMPHGGPESRDYYGYDPYAQFLASRGYVVVQPNFRGSIGFGRAFGDAGRGQWGRLMQDDVTDVVQHMIATGVADPQRICIVGSSYGGYAALAGVSLTPELYRCAISIAGVSDLPEALRTERSENGITSTSYYYWQRSIGSLRDDRDALIATSPARLADRITAPVLLLHGETDDNVFINQSEIMERAMRRAGKDVRFVRIPDSGHYWNSWTEENRLIVYRETEAFLAQHLAPAQ